MLLAQAHQCHDPFAALVRYHSDAVGHHRLPLEESLQRAPQKLLLSDILHLAALNPLLKEGRGLPEEAPMVAVARNATSEAGIREEDSQEADPERPAVPPAAAVEGHAWEVDTPRAADTDVAPKRQEAQRASRAQGHQPGPTEANP